MKTKELLQALARQVGLTSLEPTEEGVYEIVFDDDLDVEIVPFAGNHLLIRSNVAHLSEEPQQQLDDATRLLKWNMANMGRQREVLALDENQRECWIYRLIRTDNIDQGAFCQQFEEFLDSLQWWRQVDADSAVSHAPMPISFIRP